MKNLILLHGAIGSKDQLAALKNLLSSRYDVYDLNFSGHGGKPVAGDFSIPAFGEEVRLFMLDHQISRADFFGYSMGGYVALHLALNHPELVGRVTTLGTKFAWDPAIAEKEIKMLNPDKISEKIPHFAAALQARHQPADWKLVLHKTADMLHGLGNGQALSLAQWAAIQHPVLICLGDDDQMVTREESIAIADALPNGRFHLLPNSKHPIEQVDLKALVDVLMG